MSYRYRVCGLSLRSPLALPLLPAEAAHDDVVIAQMAADEPMPSRRSFAGTADCATLSFPVMGRFTVRGGKELIVPFVHEATERRIAAIVIGTALTHLCHQRGRVPLHAATVLLNGRAIALAGTSGIGKSTLLDAFVQAGHRFMSDDLCAVELPSGGSQREHARAIALPHGPWVKLRDDVLNKRSAGAARFKASGDKTWVDLAAHFHAESAPLAAIFLIVDGAHDDTIRIERLSGIEAITAAPLVVARWHQAKASQGFAVLSERLMALFGRVPLYRLRRPRTLDRLGEVVTSLERFTEKTEAATRINTHNVGGGNVNCSVSAGKGC